MNPKSLVPAAVLLLVSLLRIVTTGLTIGSGGSAGVFGSSMVIGGCGGGAVGIVLHQLWPGLVVNPASFVIVGMAGFFAAAAKTPFSTLLMVVELTTDYGLLLPTLWVCSISFLFSGPESIYCKQVAGRTVSPAHQGSLVMEALSTLLVRDFLKPDAPLTTLHADEPIAAVVTRLGDTLHRVLPVLDADGRLLGVVDLDEQLLHALHPPDDWNGRPVRAAMRADPPVLRPTDTVGQALEIFLQADLPALPVVDNERFLAMARRADLAAGYLREVRGG
jgi:CIC family chloride channel protein